MSINSTNVLEVSSMDLVNFINNNILKVQVPVYTANHQVWGFNCVQLLPYYANCTAWLTEMYNLVYSAYNTTKADKKDKADTFSERYYLDLEAKKEILYRTMQTLERMYEATSRIMTGVSAPNNMR